MKTLSIVGLSGLLIAISTGLQAQSLLSYDKAPTVEAAELAVSPDIELLLEAPPRLQFPLPSGDSVTYFRDYLETRAGGMSWVGTSSGGDQMVLTLEQGFTFATLESRDGLYQLAPQAGGHVLKTPLFELDVETYCTTDHSAVPALVAPGDRAEPPGDAKAGNELDVLVLYTPVAEQAYGQSGMVGWAQYALDLGNTIFRNSQMPARMRLVGVRKAFFQETGSTGQAVNWMINSQQAKDLRNEVGADLVGMLVQSGSACGTAATIPSGNINSFSEFMFQATRIGCLGGYTFSHEMGHLIGMEHDPANGRAQQFASFPWSYGHFVDGHFSTVMSYRSECEQGCTRRPYYSSPSISFQGQPTGIAGQRNNRRTGNAITPITSGYRQPVAGEPPDAPSDLVATARSAFHVDLAWTDRSSNENSFEIERADAGSFAPIATLAAGTTSFADSVDPSTSYSYRIRASNGFGASDYSSTAEVETPAPDLSDCQSDDSVVCMLGGRFEVRVDWTDFEGDTGAGHVVQGNSEQSAIFWFFNAENWEMMVKMVDACSFNDRFWVFAAATTNVAYKLEVRDTETGQIKVYSNELGTSAPAVTDTAALATCQ